MENKAKRNASPIEWAVAGQAKPGCEESGDQYLVKLIPERALIAVVDGLGHGEKASKVAKTAIATMEQYANNSIVSLLNRCHQALLKSRRGAVISIAIVDTDKKKLTWLGVGNVRGILLHADSTASRPRESLLLRGGIVGYQLPTPRPVEIAIEPGDTLIFATDGIRSGFTGDLPQNGSPQAMADKIFEEYGRGTDDALVLVARYLDKKDT